MRTSYWDEPATPTSEGVLWAFVVLLLTPVLVWLSLIDPLVLLGVAVVLPLALGGRAWPWRLAALAVLTSFLMPAGVAAVFVVPFLVVAAAVLLQRIRTIGAFERWRIGDTVAVVAAGYALVAAGALMLSRFGLTPFRLYEPIVELTAVRYTFAGSVALVLAGATWPDARGAWRRVSLLAVVLTAAAPPIVALRFVTGAALPQVGGAVVMTLGVWLTATLQLRAVIGNRLSRATALLLISGLAVWVLMILAIAWAAGQHWSIPVLSIPDMERTHGVANALAFSLCGLLGRRRAAAATPKHGAMVMV
jgi:hypothetical protein